MIISDRRALKEEAAQALAQAPNAPRRLVLQHTAILAGASFIVTLLNYWLTHMIAQTGGLGGIGQRTLLSTVQSLLQLSLQFAIPFWQMGLTYCFLQFARQQAVSFRDLGAGFLRFGPILRLMLCRLVIYMGAAILAANVSAILFLMSPLSGTFLELLEPLMGITDPNYMLDDATMAALMQSMLPMLVLMGIGCLTLIILLEYRFRLADYLLMDGERPGALRALTVSHMLMRGNRMDMFRLDLSFWWFFLLQGLLTLVSYGDQLLPLVGVSLPISGDVAYLVFYGLYLAGLVALYWWAGARVETTYTVAYDKLRQGRYPAQPPQNPWNTQA